MSSCDWKLCAAKLKEIGNDERVDKRRGFWRWRKAVQRDEDRVVRREPEIRREPLVRGKRTEVVVTREVTVRSVPSTVSEDKVPFEHRARDLSATMLRLPTKDLLKVLPPRSANTNGCRKVWLDGSNIAKSYGNDLVFDCRGLVLALLYFIR